MSLTADAERPYQAEIKMLETEHDDPSSNPPLSYAQIRIQIDLLWKQIRGFHQTQSMLTVRNAANLVGFWRFPVGWTWQEYGRLLEQPLPYEKKAGSLHHANLDTQSCAHNECCSRAEAYRMTEVEAYLLRFINRNEVLSALFDEWGDGRPFRDQLCHSVKWVNVRAGYIRYRRRAGCEIDALSLIDVIDKCRKEETSSRPPTYNWFVIERWIRNHIERNGTAASDSEILRMVEDWYSAQYGKDVIPTRSTLARRISDLRTEYEFPITKSTFHRMQSKRR
jgi:hypothetical protein